MWFESDSMSESIALMFRSCFIQSPSWRSCLESRTNGGRPGIGRHAVDFDAAESALFQLEFEPYLFLTRDQKRSCMTEEGIVADEE